MKNYSLSIITLLCLSLGFGQTSEEEKVKQTVTDFFDAFHKQDTVKLKSMANGNITMQSISIDENGKTKISENDFNAFVKSIAGIPKDKTFKEKLLDFNIKVDKGMANAWTPYEFWFDGNLSHCGVNSFMFIKKNDTWKIIYLVDTRQRNDCSK